MFGRAGQWQRSPQSIKDTECKSSGCALKAVDLGRSVTGLGFETEEREIASDQAAEVSRGRSSCASSEGPNGPRKGIKGAMSTRRNSTTDKRQKSQYRLAFPEESRGAAPRASVEGTESELAKRRAESPATVSLTRRIAGCGPA